MPEELMWVAAAMALVIFLAVTVLMLALVRPWIRALLSGAQASMVQILAMRLRGTPATLIIDAYIQLRARGKNVDLCEVERQYLAYRQRVRESGDLVELVEKSLT